MELDKIKEKKLKLESEIEELELKEKELEKEKGLLTAEVNSKNASISKIQETKTNKYEELKKFEIALGVLES